MDDQLATFLSFAKTWYPYGIPIIKNKVVLVSFVTNNVETDKELIVAAAEKGMKLLSSQYEITSDVNSCKGKYVVVMGKSIWNESIEEGSWDKTGRYIVTASAISIQTSYEEKKKFWEHLKAVVRQLNI